MKKTAPKSKSRKPKRMFSWMSPKLEVRDAKKCGKSIFAKVDIKKGTLLTIFGGYIMTPEEEIKLNVGVHDEGVQIGDNFVIGIKKLSESEDTSYFNHSCDPNAGFRGQIFLVAMKDIKKDQQVCFDYAMVLSKTKGLEFYKMKCECGSRNCRGFVTDNDWKNRNMQKKYAGYFQWYLQEKIKKLKK